jgi:hypothetical protein
MAPALLTTNANVAAALDSENERQRVLQTSNEILSYLEEHPRAADSITGVLAFWVHAGAHHGSLAIVEQSLDRLTAMGRVIQEALPDGQILYRAAPPSESH